MQKYGTYADEMIYATIKGHAHVEVWGNLDDDELEMLANFWIAAGKKSPKAARRVRGAVNLYENTLGPGMILIPRMIRTIQLYLRAGGISLS